MKVLFISPEEDLSYHETYRPQTELPLHFVLPVRVPTEWSVCERPMRTLDYTLQWYGMRLPGGFAWRTPIYLERNYRMASLKTFSDAKKHQILGYVLAWPNVELMDMRL